jgi:hypothetical protein
MYQVNVRVAVPYSVLIGLQILSEENKTNGS